MNLQCIIVDDELPASTELYHLLKEIGGVEVLYCAHDGSDALTAVRKLRPHALFLDIKMPGMDGFDVAREVLSGGHQPQIVFTTAYDDFAIDAFEVSAVDYVLKPFSRERLEKTVKRLMESNAQRLGSKDVDAIVDRLKDGMNHYPLVRLSVYDKGRIIFLPPGDICFCQASYGHSTVLTPDSSYDCHASLDDIEDRFAEERFFRVHRSYLVNIEHIQDVVPYVNGRYVITMKDNARTEVPVSRNRLRLLKKVLGF